jgi:hypothetical protein
MLVRKHLLPIAIVTRVILLCSMWFQSAASGAVLFDDRNGRGERAPCFFFGRYRARSSCSTSWPWKPPSFPLPFETPGPALWASAGKDLVTISYKWFDHGRMLPIEGERTGLPGPVKPGDSASTVESSGAGIIWKLRSENLPGSGRRGVVHVYRGQPVDIPANGH